jgi:transposase
VPSTCSTATRRSSADREARRRFATLLADKAYSSQAFRQACIERGTEPIIPKPKTPGIKGLGKLRYVVEQTFALLHQFRRLAVR